MRRARPGSRSPRILLSFLTAAAASIAASRALAGALVQEGAGAQAAADTSVRALADTSPEQPAPVPPTQAELDEEIRAGLQAVYDRVPALSGIDVEVSAGVVGLTGQVPDSRAAERAVTIAEAREGVVVVDDSELDSGDAGARIEDTWERLRGYGSDSVAMLPLFVAAFVIVAAAGTLAWLVGRLPGPPGPGRRNPFLRALLQRLLQFALVVGGLIVALQLLDATALVGAVVGTAGLAGLALGFAFKDIAENYLAGIILSLRNPFAKNDLIVVGGHEGKVVRLTGRETVLMTPDGNHVQIPNATVFREPLINYTRNPRRRFGFEVGVANESDLAAALDIGIAVLRGMEGVTDEPPPDAVVSAFGDSTMTLRFFGWVDQRQAEFLRVRSEAIRLVKAGLEEAGVELPSPEYRLRWSPGAGPEAEAEAPTRPGAPPAVEPPEKPPPAAAQRDVSVDHTLDEQIEEERRGAEEEDLLEEDGGS